MFPKFFLPFYISTKSIKIIILRLIVKTFLNSPKVSWLQIPWHFMSIFRNTFGENVEVNTRINKKLDIITTILILQIGYYFRCSKRERLGDKDILIVFYGLNHEHSVSRVNASRNLSKSTFRNHTKIAAAKDA